VIDRPRLVFWVPLFGAVLLTLAGGPIYCSGVSLSAGRSETFKTGARKPPLQKINPVVGAIFAVPPEGEGVEGKTDSREPIYKTINFIILVGGLAFVLRKPLAAFFLSRSAEIRESIDGGRKALAESQSRMSAIEEKLRHLEEEIAAFKASAAREMEAEHERMRLATAAEAEKMLESARSRMDTATRAAKLNLRFYIAGEALKQAERMIRDRLDDATRTRLVSQFVARLDVPKNRN
jgi:F-type H+-transporting ATPase subunit b